VRVERQVNGFSKAVYVVELCFTESISVARTWMKPRGYAWAIFLWGLVYTVCVFLRACYYYYYYY